MKTLNYGFIAICLIVLGVARAYPAENQAAGAGAQVHICVSPKEITWAPAPPVVPKGAEAAVLDGNPFASSGSYTLRLKMPAGYKIPPHWHPTDENVTVLSGTLGAGMGDKFDKSSASLLKPRACAAAPAAQADARTIVRRRDPVNIHRDWELDRLPHGASLNRENLDLDLTTVV
jgi:hypothetical protein